MKKLIVVLVLLVLVLPNTRKVFAQNEGVITYEITVNNHRTLAPEREGMKAMIPQYRTFKQQLFFNANESLYKPLIEEEDDDNGGQGTRRRMQGAVNYTNTSSEKFLA